MSRSLFVDIGNTRVKWAWHDGQRWFNRGVCLHTDFEPRELVAGVQAHSGVSAWVSCVGAVHLLTGLGAVLKQHGVPLFQSWVSDSACGIKNAYVDTHKLGVDRWLAVIGARVVVPEGSVIVVDAGTATNIECLDANNVFQGGAILPGLRLMHDSLIGRTEGIESDVSDTFLTIGKTTQQCVNSGVAYGLAGAIERIATEMQRELVSDQEDAQPCSRGDSEIASVILTGGDAATLEPLISLKGKSMLVEDLIMMGMLTLSRERSL